MKEARRKNKSNNAGRKEIINKCREEGRQEGQDEKCRMAGRKK